MRDETFSEPRRTLARNGIIVLLIWLGLHIFFQSHNAQTPSVAAAADVSTMVGVTTRPSASPTTPVILVRFEWLNRCQPASGQLGFYAVNDAPCQPSRIASLTWLQSQLTANAVIASNEYLDQASNPVNAACSVIVLTHLGAPAGWVCSDANGLYRTDTSGRDPGSRVQLQG